VSCIETKQHNAALQRSARAWNCLAALAAAVALVACGSSREFTSPSAERAPPPSDQARAPAGLPAPARARNWSEFRVLAAQRLVQANGKRTYDGVVPDVLLAIPVLEVELNGDGSVRRVVVMRKPGQALDTIQLAVDAVYRAAPYGSVAHLPKPWKFVETFLYRDDRRFKPRTLD
jgi:hypothetical protein